MASKPYCVLHHGNTCFTTEPLKSFDDKSWANVLRADKRRRELYVSSKFFSIILPDKPDDNTLYHSTCYKVFTAVPNKVPIDKTPKYSELTTKRTLRGEVDHPSTSSSSGVFQAIYIFCNQVSRTVTAGGKREYLSSLEMDSSVKKILDAANTLKDDAFLAKISGLDLFAKEAKIHNSCRSAYIKKSLREKDSVDKSVDSKQLAFATLRRYVQVHLIDIESSILLTELHKVYAQSLGVILSILLIK